MSIFEFLSVVIMCGALGFIVSFVITAAFRRSSRKD